MEKRNTFSIWTILAILIYFIIFFIINLIGVISANAESSIISRANEILGPYTFILLILIAISIISIFLKYNYRFVVISLPFLWNLLLPLKRSGEPIFVGGIINIFYYLFIKEYLMIIPSLLLTILSIIPVIYLFIKQFKENDKKIIETIFSILLAIIIVFLIMALILAQISMYITYR